LDISDAQSAKSSQSVGRPSGLLSAGGILDRIVDAKANRLRVAKNEVRSQAAAIDPLPPEHDRKRGSFRSAISTPNRTNIIAEVKRRSPSKGIIREDFDPLAIAASYVAGGAAALSVLTEEDFFGGSLDFLKAIRASHPEIPLLRKDFIFDEFQLLESRDAGASAVLLITAILGDELLRDLIAESARQGLDALVEVHTAAELQRAVAAGADIIGVNNRDLIDFTVTLDTSVRLAQLAPSNAVLVTESGITSGPDVAILSGSGFSAFLVGEHFMRATDPGAELKSLVENAEKARAAGVALMQPDFVLGKV